jgi:hypothetical protein
VSVGITVHGTHHMCLQEKEGEAEACSWRKEGTGAAGVANSLQLVN